MFKPSTLDDRERIWQPLDTRCHALLYTPASYRHSDRQGVDFALHANFSLFFVHPSSNCLRVNKLTAFKICSHRHAWMVLKSLNQRLIMFRRVVFFSWPLSLLFPFPYSADICLSTWCYATGGSFCSWGVLVRPNSPL